MRPCVAQAATGIHYSTCTCTCYTHDKYLLTFDGEVWVRASDQLQHVSQDHLSPVAAVGNETQVRQGSLRWTHLVLTPCQQVTWEHRNRGTKTTLSVLLAYLLHAQVWQNMHTCTHSCRRIMMTITRKSYKYHATHWSQWAFSHSPSSCAVAEPEYRRGCSSGQSASPE